MRLILPGLLLLGMLAALTACGRGTGAQPGANGHPDSVHIELDVVGPKPAKPTVTLTVASLVQQLYATIYALPQLSAQQGCTAERGPHYTLTFSEGDQTLVTVRAMRDGCHPVIITGETQNRRGTAEFWAQLDEAIYQGTPPASPDQLAIAYTPDPALAPHTARIISAETAQRLYNAILALPLHPYGYQCPTPGISVYQLAFQTRQQVIASAIDPACKTISLNGAYQTRGGVYSLNDDFNQLFAKIVAGASFAPAQPDQVTLTVQNYATISHQTIGGNTALIRQLYHKAYTLESVTTRPACLEADKVAGKGTWYTFAFSQWGLPILQLNAYEGSCLYVTRSMTGQIVQGDQAFWDLVHRVASQQ